MASRVFAFAVGLPVLLSAFSSVGCSSETGFVDEDDTGQEATEDELVAGNQLSTGRIAGLLRGAGFPESSIGKMVCTAKYESRYHDRAWNRNRNGTMDRGLFQINSIHLGTMRGCPRSGNALFDPETNVKCAYAIYRAQGMGAWYGYRAHRNECDNTRAPASSGAPTPAEAEGNDGGGCYSPTLRQGVDELACVQGQSNRVWYQCKSGAWVRGVNETAKTGPHGNCSSFVPL